MTKKRNLAVVPDEEPTPTPEEIAEAQAAADKTLMDALTARDTVVRPRRVRATIGSNFVDTVELIKQAKNRTRLSEATLLKVWELSMMWALNNRQDVDTSDLFTPSDESEAEDEEALLPIPNEIIDADDTADAEFTEE